MRSESHVLKTANRLESVSYGYHLRASICSTVCLSECTAEVCEMASCLVKALLRISVKQILAHLPHTMLSVQVDKAKPFDRDGHRDGQVQKHTADMLQIDQ